MLATSNELLRGWRWRSQGFDDKGKLTKHTPSLLRVGGDDSSRSMCTSASTFAGRNYPRGRSGTFALLQTVRRVASVPLVPLTGRRVLAALLLLLNVR